MAWLISQATAEISLEIALIATLKANLHLLKSWHIGGTTGKSSKLYPLVGNDGLTKCTDVDKKWAYFGSMRVYPPLDPTSKAYTCGARLKEIMNEGTSEIVARKQIYDEGKKLGWSYNPCQTNDAVNPHVCAKRHMKDYAVSPSGACKKEHELELDITLEFAIEAKLSGYIALSAVGGAVAFNYGRVTWYLETE